jgi:tetratricopeptide (TPR) repeat protein
MARPAADAALDAYTKALSALHKRDWEGAASQLRKVVEKGDRPEVRDRARQYLAACESRIAEVGAKKQTEPADADPFLLAVFEKNRGDFERALEICRKGGRDQKDERLAYLAASIYALQAQPEESSRALARAIELNPTNRIHAFHDPDFSQLRHDREFQRFFGLS